MDAFKFNFHACKQIAVNVWKLYNTLQSHDDIK